MGSILALCDEEEEYTLLMSDYLRRQKGLPWRLITYTGAEEMMNDSEENAPDILVVSESSYRDDMRKKVKGKTVILSEDGLKGPEGVRIIEKYSAAENVLGSLIDIFFELEKEADASRCAAKERSIDLKPKLIGFFSPVGRCLQTTTALTLGHLLSTKHKTLYLNFEHYSGHSEIEPEAREKDLADMLYFLSGNGERFELRFRTIVKKIGGLDYIPPMRSGQNLLTIAAGDWLKMLNRLSALGEYEYIVMDLSESMQGLFEILRRCDRIYMNTGKDRIAESKITRFEQVLSMYEYRDVLDKTDKCEPPKITRIPCEVEQYTSGVMADYARELVRKLEAE
ncbi:MAG: hypothetical protein K6G57_04130 [Lachnospiraceae bacterium]|nr:hypothetical protein [Lachnospiraceae bacterium]